MSKPYEQKLNFIDAVLIEIVACEVRDMPHNQVGGKGKAVTAFMSRIAKESACKEFKDSTFTDIYASFQKLWCPMALEYEAQAELLYAKESPEYKIGRSINLSKKRETERSIANGQLYYLQKPIPSVKVLLDCKSNC